MHEGRCPDNECHETVSKICAWVWGESKSNGANQDIREIKEEMRNKLTVKPTIVMTMIIAVLIPTAVWAWNLSVTLDRRITRLEIQQEQIKRIDRNVSKLLERLPDNIKLEEDSI